MKKGYHWFTIIELLGAIIIISVALLSILWLLRVAVTYTNKTRQETIAINLAREGIEWVYNRRNTNRLRQSWEKDKNRLNINNETWANSSRFQWWWQTYRLKYIPSTYGRIPTFMSGWQTINNNSILWNQNLLLNWSDFVWWVAPDTAGKFYRAIIGIWLYEKNSSIVWGDMITCADGNWDYNVTEKCNNTTPKEYRFCSRVEYEKDLKWKVELCGSITNYQE